MNEDIKFEILKLLSKSETSWNWYKIDRALSARGLGGKCNVADVANALAKEGLLTADAHNNPAMPTYSITVNGRRLLAARA